MQSKKRSINIGALLGVLAVVAGFLWAAFYRLDVDADIVSALPGNDPVLRDGREVMAHHPLQDLLIIDVGHPYDHGEVMRRRIEQNAPLWGIESNAGLKCGDDLFSVRGSRQPPSFCHNMNGDIRAASRLVDVRFIGIFFVPVTYELLVGVGWDLLNVCDWYVHVGQCGRGEALMLITLLEVHC